jgi:hypothetical protein
MNDHLRYARASILAPLPFALLFAGVCLIGSITWNGNSEADDAPVRAAAAFVTLSPLLYLFTAMALYFFSRAMGAAGILSRRGLISTAVAASLSAGVLAALSSPFGPRDAAISAAIFATLALATTVPMFLLWWQIAHNLSWSGRATRARRSR